MKYVYVKDSEGFTVKKKENEVLPDEVLITKKEHEELCGITYYKILPKVVSEKALGEKKNLTKKSELLLIWINLK